MAILTETNGYLALDGKPITRQEACAAGYAYYCQEHILNPTQVLNPAPDQPTLPEPIPATCTLCKGRYLLIAAAVIFVFVVLK